MPCPYDGAWIIRGNGSCDRFALSVCVLRWRSRSVAWSKSIALPVAVYAARSPLQIAYFADFVKYFYLTDSLGQVGGVSAGCWGVMVGAEAVRTTLPLSFITHPVASTNGTALEFGGCLAG